MPVLKFEVQDGIIEGNFFSASISLISSNQEYSAGFIDGSFYGPDASELALEIVFYEIRPNQQCGMSTIQGGLSICNYKILTGTGNGVFKTLTN